MTTTALGTALTAWVTTCTVAICAACATASVVWAARPRTEGFDKKAKKKKKVPKWATPPGAWLGGPTGPAMHATNLKDIAAADAAGERYDVVVYGDSITAGLRALLRDRRARAAAFDPFFGRDVRFGAFGCPGNVAEDLAWRLTEGGERPRLDPRVVAFWIGTNNLTRGMRPAERLDWLLRWARAEMPASRVVVLGLLPRTTIDVGPSNAEYEDLCRRRGATFVRCGEDLDPLGPLYVDGLHVNAGGYARVLRCLGARLKPLLADPEESVGP